MNTELKYEIDIEGRFFPWTDDDISTPDIIRLAGWPAGTEVIEVDDNNEQRQLGPDEVVELKAGHGYAKRHRFQRGLGADQ